MKRTGSEALISSAEPSPLTSPKRHHHATLSPTKQSAPFPFPLPSDPSHSSSSALVDRLQEFLPRLHQSNMGLSLGGANGSADPELEELDEDDAGEFGAYKHAGKSLIQEYHGSDDDEDDEESDDEDVDDSDLENDEDIISDDEHDNDEESAGESDSDISDDDEPHDPATPPDHFTVPEDGDEEEDDDEYGFEEPVYAISQQNPRKTTAFENDPYVEMNIGMGMFDVQNPGYSNPSDTRIPEHFTHGLRGSGSNGDEDDALYSVGDIATGPAVIDSMSWLMNSTDLEED